MTHPADILRRARALIDSPEKWCQVHMHDGDRYCSLGALREAIGIKPGKVTPSQRAIGNECLALLKAPKLGGQALADWQDAKGRTHKQVMRRWDRAIALAESRPQ